MRRCVGRGRHKWTVNYKFVSEQFFVSPPLSMALLACTIGTMGLFGFTRWAKPRTADAYAWLPYPRELNQAAAPAPL